METHLNIENLNRIDILDLKIKGMSIEKISKLLEVPVHEIDNHIQSIEKLKQLSGVY